MTLTVVVSVVEAVVADAVVTADEAEVVSEGIWEYVPDTGSDDLGPVDVSVPELTTDVDDPAVEAEDTVEEVVLEKDEAELLLGGEPAPVTLNPISSMTSCSCSYAHAHRHETRYFRGTYSSPVSAKKSISRYV